MTRYQLRNNGVIDAVLWRGMAVDLAVLPNFNQIAQRIDSIDSTGFMAFYDTEGKEHRCAPNQVYIYCDRDTIGVMSAKEFSEKYEACPMAMPHNVPIKRLSNDE